LPVARITAENYGALGALLFPFVSLWLTVFPALLRKTLSGLRPFCIALPGEPHGAQIII